MLIYIVRNIQILEKRACLKFKLNRFFCRRGLIIEKPAVVTMTTLAGGFLVTNYHDAGRKVSKSNLDRGRKQKIPLRQTTVDAWHG